MPLSLPFFYSLSLYPTLFLRLSLSCPKVVDINSIEEGWMGLDIGPKTLSDIQAGLADCKTVIWNGPMGKLIPHCTYVT